MKVPSFRSPPSVAGLCSSAAWKTTIASGVSTGALVRIGRAVGPRRTNERTSEPFFSDPYETEWAPFRPILSTAAVANTCPAACAPSPPIDSSRISKNRPVFGNDTIWLTDRPSLASRFISFAFMCWLSPPSSAIRSGPPSVGFPVVYQFWIEKREVVLMQIKPHSNSSVNSALHHAEQPRQPERHLRDIGNHDQENEHGQQPRPDGDGELGDAHLGDA